MSIYYISQVKKVGDKLLESPIAILKTKKGFRELCEILGGDNYQQDIVLKIDKFIGNSLWEERKDFQIFKPGTRAFDFKQNRGLKAIFPPGEKTLIWHTEERIPAIEV